MPAQTNAAPLTITDSTIAYNTAAGRRRASRSRASSRSSDAARRHDRVQHRARQPPASAASRRRSSSASIQGAIIAGNTRDVGAERSRSTTARSAAAVTDQGGNVDDDRRHVRAHEPRRAAQHEPATRDDARRLAAAGARRLPATSPAVDFADCGGRTRRSARRAAPPGRPLRRRRVRVQPGARHDHRAAPVRRSRSARTRPVSTFECSLDGAPFTPCAAPVRPGRRARDAHPRGACGGPAGPSRTRPRPP